MSRVCATFVCVNSVLLTYINKQAFYLFFRMIFRSFPYSSNEYRPDSMIVTISDNIDAVNVMTMIII